MVHHLLALSFLPNCSPRHHYSENFAKVRRLRATLEPNVGNESGVTVRVTLRDGLQLRVEPRKSGVKLTKGWEFPLTPYTFLDHALSFRG
jgi:hypothetical protein